MRVYGENENLTLTKVMLETARPQRVGGRIRAFCPFHGSDRQRSLSVKVESGAFRCFSCGAWGYTQEARERRQVECGGAVRGYPVAGSRGPDRRLPVVEGSRVERPRVEPRAEIRGPDQESMREALDRYQVALPGSLGERYLGHRGIRAETARRYGVGYAAPGEWMHRSATGKPVRQGRWGRVVFPHTDPEGQMVNLYGRAVGSAERVKKADRHDHLGGPKGAFNARAFREGEGPLYVCEGVFDALSLIEAGYDRTVAIFGINGMRWEWSGPVDEIVMALDADETGMKNRVEMGRQGALRGKRIWFLDDEVLGGASDLNEAWIKGVLGVIPARTHVSSREGLDSPSKARL